MLAEVWQNFVVNSIDVMLNIGLSGKYFPTNLTLADIIFFGQVD